MVQPPPPHGPGQPGPQQPGPQQPGPQQPGPQQPGQNHPAAPTQLVFPGQVGAPQQQYAPTPAQAASQGGTARAVGFPGYRSPAPSPVNRTSAVVGAVVVAATVLFAVVGFVLVSGRGAGTPEAAVQGYLDALVDGDAGRAHDLLCESLGQQIPEETIEQGLMGGFVASALQFEVLGSSDTTLDGRPAVDVQVAVTALGQTTQQDVVVVDEDGYRVCGGSGF